MSDFLTLVFLILFVAAIVASTFKRKSVSRNKKVYLWISVIVSTMLVGITAPDLPENSKPEKVTSAEEEKKPDKPKKPTVKKEAKFEGTFLRWAPASPATGTFYFMVENTGNKPGKFYCSLEMYELAGMYKGKLSISIDEDLKPGDIYAGAEPMIITNQGSMYVDLANIRCVTR
jgi:hypothetical protein